MLEVSAIALVVTKVLVLVQVLARVQAQALILMQVLVQAPRNDGCDEQLQQPPQQLRPQFTVGHSQLLVLQLQQAGHPRR